MKKTLFLALLACVTMVFTSCNKEKELPGTSWKTHTVIDQDMSMEGITAHINMVMDATMKFTDATKGTMDMTTSGSMSAMGMTFPIDTEEETITFTYTFDGEKGTLTGKDHTGAESTLPFTYNKKDKSWSLESDGKQREIFRFNEDGTIRANMPNGKQMDLTLDEAGLMQARMAVDGSCYALR